MVSCEGKRVLKKSVLVEIVIRDISLCIKLCLEGIYNLFVNIQGLTLSAISINQTLHMHAGKECWNKVLQCINCQVWQDSNQIVKVPAFLLEQQSNVII